MGLQEQFKKFNSNIKLTNIEHDDLMSKRDILLGKLSGSEELPGFEKYDQGSYAMHLGVKPIEGRQHDIDVALRFHSNEDGTEPFEYKDAIYRVLEHHTEYGAEIKKPCVTVTYKRKDEPAYHVDLVPYVYADCNDADSQMFISKGETEETAIWERADPVGLVDYIESAVEQGDERDQFRRIVRYLKRWKMLRFLKMGHGEPPSIGVTLIAADNFSYAPEDDLQALRTVCSAIQDRFFFARYDGNGFPQYDIKCGMPDGLKFEPGSDVFGKMTLVQKTGFKQKIDNLSNVLEDVSVELDLVEQCRLLKGVFGDEFEVPDVRAVSRRQPRSFIPSTSSSG